MAEFVDFGHFASDVAAHGLSVVISNKATFTEDGTVWTPRLDKNGQIDDLVATKIDPQDIAASHVRVLPEVNVAGGENIPKLNSNEVKRLARDKYGLYKRVLSDYQVETSLLSTDLQTYDEMVEVIAGVDGTEVVLKNNTGSGGRSTKTFAKEDAAAWLDEAIRSEGGLKPQILQPKLEFGRLPSDIETSDGDKRELLRRAQTEDLLSELRIFVVKRGMNHELVPILRIVPNSGDSMASDEYVDAILPNDLQKAVFEATREITDKVATEASGTKYVLGAVDFYFDKHQAPHVMEANFRSPTLPLTEESPVAGRRMHKAVAATLAEMAGKE
jgi:glutathione synthase/RimK-type ligase-like ATP-grasp enzyme